MLVYVNFFLTVGVASSRTHINPSFASYKRTTRILKLWLAKQRYAKRKAIAQKLSGSIHASSKEIISDVIPYLRIMYKHNMHLDLDLNDEEIEWLRK